MRTGTVFCKKCCNREAVYMKRPGLNGFSSFCEKLRSRILKVLPKKKHGFFHCKAVLITVSVAAAVLAVAVLLPNIAGVNHFVVAAKAQDLMRGIKFQPLDVSDAVTQNYEKSAQNFSVNLFKTQYTAGENNLVSPASAYFCLGMVANGASGTTRAEFLNVLGKYGPTTEGLNRAYKAYANGLSVKYGSTGISLSNSIWLSTGVKVKNHFLQENADYFGAGVHTLDFRKAASVNVMNSWIKTNTKGRIDRLIDRIDPGDVMFLINTLTFEAKWKFPFDTTAPATQEEFYKENGETVPMRFMGLQQEIGYIGGKNETAVLLPYDDGRFAMLCILPKEGAALSDYVAGMDENTIPSLIQKKKDTMLSVQLPRFMVTADKTFNEALKKMGLVDAFNQDADFSGMTSNQTVYVSKVRQKTRLKVDELGTQAAAATYSGMKTTVALVKNRICFDHPFVFAVVDLKTNLPLFIGTKQE